MPMTINERNKLYAAKRSLQLLLLYEEGLIRIPAKYKPDSYGLTPSNLDGWVSVVKEFNRAYFNAIDWDATLRSLASDLAVNHRSAAEVRISRMSAAGVERYIQQLEAVSEDIKANQNLKDFIKLADALSKIAASTPIDSVPA